MREKIIEAEGVKYAEARDWLVYKLSSPSRPGVHDRIHFKDGVCFTIEYKTTGKKATPKQRDEAVLLSYAGIPSRCCDSVQKARAFIDRMGEALRSGHRELFIDALSEDISSFEP